MMSAHSDSPYNYIELKDFVKHFFGIFPALPAFLPTAPVLSQNKGTFLPNSVGGIFCFVQSKKIVNFFYSSVYLLGCNTFQGLV